MYIYKHIKIDFHIKRSEIILKLILNSSKYIDLISIYHFISNNPNSLYYKYITYNITGYRKYKYLCT